MAMRGFSITTLGLVLAALLLTSCAPAAGPSANAPATSLPSKGAKGSTTAPAPTPKPDATKPNRGGMLNLLHIRTIDNHDIIQLSANFHAYPPYERLFRWAPDLKTLVYELATGWEVSKDGLTVVFNLRKDVKWHDGKPFTSADAATTIKWITNPPKGFMSRQQELFAMIKSVEAPDDHTIKLGLSYPSAVLDTAFALGNTVMYPKHVLETKGSMKDDVLGTGPFKFKRYVPGVSMEYERNKDYWDPELPYLDGLKYYVIIDASARFAALRTHRVHRYQQLSTTEAEVVEKDLPGARLVSHPNASGVESLMRVTRPPFDDVRVRRAISLAIDRQALNQFVTQGAGKIGLTMFPGGRWVLPDSEIAKLPGYRQPKDQDIAEAKRLLAEAGFAQGLKITNYVQNMPGCVKAATAIREQVARIGIDMEIPVIDVVERQRRLYSEDFGMMTNWIDTLGDDPEVATGNVWKMERSSFFQAKLQRPDGTVEVGTGDKQANELLNKIRRAPDFEQRRAATWEIEKYILDQAPLLIQVWMPGFTGLWKEVQDYEINPWNMEIYNGVWLQK